ncbi:hypothetical protein SBBP1_760006 [Burkholderiales bacterium]|nr:hypothetical protein SBBP1_760006 [Burkholderiales bacterium]
MLAVRSCVLEAVEDAWVLAAVETLARLGACELAVLGFFAGTPVEAPAAPDSAVLEQAGAVGAAASAVAGGALP